MKFEKFVGENEAKRCRALKKYETAQEQNILKQREIEELAKKLKQLRARWELYKITGFVWGCCSVSHFSPQLFPLYFSRHQVLKDRMAKYKIYEDYLMKTLDYLPSSKSKTDFLVLIT